jgi:tetratricopeptide (TPR) repeat protein
MSENGNEIVAEGQDEGELSSLAANLSGGPLDVLEHFQTGDVAAAYQLARAELASANSGAERAQWRRWAAVCAFWEGDFAHVEELGSDGGLEGELLQGSLHALRGHEPEADEAYERALELALASQDPVLEASTRALRAQFMAGFDPERSLEDSRLAEQLARSTNQAWWVAFARFTEAVSLDSGGRFVEAGAAYEEAISVIPTVLERAAAELHFAEFSARAGDKQRAIALIDRVIPVFERANAKYWLTRTLLARASVERDRGGRWLRQARAIAGDDLAYTRLFVPARGLNITIGTTSSAVLGDEPIAFITRHAELALYALVMASPAGIPADEFAGWLWPDSARERSRPRLRTMLWQLRNGLGSEAWRVQRSRGMVGIELNGVNVEFSTNPAESMVMFTNFGLDQPSFLAPGI